MANYMQNTLAASSSVLTGVISEVHVKEDPQVSAGWGRYRITVDVRPSTVPGQQMFYGIRYYGPVELEVPNPLPSDPNHRSKETATHIYDMLIEDASLGVGEEAVFNKIISTLTGRLVTLSRVGGRWMIQ